MRAPLSAEPSPEQTSTQEDHWLMGSEGPQRRAIKRLMFIVGTYAMANGFLLASLYVGLIEPWQMAVQTVYHATGLLLFYVWLRSGRTLHWPDPSMAYVQVLFSMSAIVLTYALSQYARGPALQLLCLALVFDMQRLNARQLRLTASGAVGLLGLTLLVTWLLAPETVNLRREIITIAMAGVQLPVIAVIAREVRRMRERQLEQRVALQQAVVQLHEVSIRDALTGIFNRQHMQNLLQDEIKRQRRHNRAFCLAILDIDHFKRVNDQHGHAVGDIVLREFAQIAHACAGQRNALARWGGEEFLLAIPECDNAQALKVLADLRQRVTQHDWTQYASGLAVRFSAGVTPYSLNEALACTLERADKGLYKAKAQGRDQVVAMAGRAS